MSDSIAIHWFRRDLRLADNTALIEAARNHDRILPVFVFDPRLLEAPDIGAPRIRYLLDCLESLRGDLARFDVPLIFRKGDPCRVLPEIAEEAGARAVFANRDYGPYARRRDEAIARELEKKSIAWHDHADLLLVEPWECLTQEGKPYTVFTPFSRRWRAVEKNAPQRAPRLRGWEKPPRSEKLPDATSLGLDSAVQLPAAGEANAAKRLRRFAQDRIGRYASDRDTPAIQGTSGLSADLKFGTVSPRQVFAAAVDHMGIEATALDPGRPPASMKNEAATRLREAGTFVSELCWRDFYQAVLFHFPGVLSGAFRERFRDVQWPEKRPEIIEAWTEGRTGFPIVDAGMRQLAATGWMHNRLRMITASFLAKILLVDWRIGERVFMQRLVDGDPAANNGGWQWSASTGTDATPYFRIFNPLLQSRKFDPDGAYLRRWIPELSDVAAPLIHEPGREPGLLERTGYPPPCVDYAERRQEALALLGAAGSAGPAPTRKPRRKTTGRRRS